MPLKLTEIFSNVIEKPIDWLWYPYIAKGKVTIIQGDPGEGKTTFALFIAAELSKSKDQKQSIPGLSREVMHTIYQSVEDDVEDTIKPKLVKLDADCNKIHFINTNQVLSLNSKEIEKSILETKAEVLILDPLQSFMGKNKSMQSVSDLREVFGAISLVASKTGCAVILVGHMNKASAMKDLYRGLGSIDIVAVARSILLIKRVEEDSDTRVLIHLKSNLAKKGKDMAFDIFDERVKWLGELTESSENLFVNEKNLKIQKACIYLTDYLKGEKRLASEMIRHMMKKGISERTIREAKKRLSIQSTREKDGWYWQLPHSNHYES